jgi:hypothetical protein
MYKFIILDIRIKKINYLIFLKYRPRSHEFLKWVIKSKNTCKNIIFHEFLYLKM